MVTQELNLMPHLSIAENIFLFEDSSYKGSFFLDRKKINKKTEMLIQEFSLAELPPVTTEGIRPDSRAIPDR